MVNTISIFGSSSGRNAGDAALLSGIMDAIDQACGRRLKYEIPTLRPEFVSRTYANDVRPVSMLPWHGTVGMLGIPTWRSLSRCDMALIYDAMLFDRKLYNPLTNYMSSVYMLFPRAKRAGKLLGMYNAGTGPVTTDAGRKMLREIAEWMDFITVRDEESLALFREIGVKNDNVIVTADAALNVRPSSPERVDGIMEKLGLAHDPEILAINVNSYLNTWTGSGQKALTKEEFAKIYAEALDAVSAELNVPILFVCTQHSDVPVTEAVKNAMRSPVKKALFSNVEHSHFDIRGVFERVSLLFAMRLHANILCSAGHTPVTALAFQKKVASYYRLLGLAEYVMSFDVFSAETVKNHILKGWADRNEIREKLRRRIPQLQREALRAAEAIAYMAKGYTPREAITRVSPETSPAVHAVR